jgi:outer membrane lipoprotein-sorting protein
VRRRDKIALAGVVLAAACCGGAQVKRSYPEPPAEEILQHLRGVRDRVKSVRAETVSDARIGKERAKVTVLIMAADGGKLRFMAMQPQGGMAADLASDGTEYCFLDANKGCGDCGPATPENVGRLVRIVMPPDDVVTFLLGSTPVLENAKAKVSWDTHGGHEILELSDGRFKQRIVLDGRDHTWDVLESEMKDAVSGKLVWRVRHKEYHSVGSVRVPGKSFFEQPSDDVLIRWKEQEVNVEIEEQKFHLVVPQGLPPC